jgi:hypothetical protein
MKPYTPIILKHAGILIVINLILFWLWFYSPFDVPRIIPGTPVNIHGLLLAITFITVLIHLCKRIIKMHPAVNVLRLTLLGTVTCFISEIVIQLIRSLTDDTDRLFSFLLGVASMTIFSAFLSFFVAYQLKTKNTKRLIMFIVGFMILCNVLIRWFPSLAG